ncbi:MAG TPA: UpxY family transcription antiterminator [Candidatus Eisenbacteria bacterium]|nr:UpxY family transcription antiterminator [Candidatus Eisenbacteria bacterium]
MHQEDNSGSPVAWHALYTRYQHERVVQQLLAEKGFETFLPLYEARHRWKDRVKQVSVPLFPSYVFIRGGLERRLDIVTTTGFHSIVSEGDRAGIVTQAEIDAMRQLVETRLRVEPHPFLKVGDRVRVKTGPLAGFEGILVRKKNQYRLVLSVELLQQSVATEVDAYQVERVSESRRRAA